MKHFYHLNVFVLLLTGLLSSACSSINGYPLKPSAPDAAYTSFNKMAREKHATTVANPDLDDVKNALSDLFSETGTKEKNKSNQQWATNEITVTGGFAAALGNLAKKTALMNTGLLLAMTGLTVDQFYGAGTTIDTHLKADEVFSCMLTELDPLTEDMRSKGALSSKDGNVAANNAVDDVIRKVNEALFLYRKAILKQTTTVSKDDFSRFAKAYSDKQIATQQATGDAASAVATAQSMVQAAGQQVAPKALAVKSLDDANNDLYAAKFIPLQTSLEACIKKF